MYCHTYFCKCDVTHHSGSDFKDLDDGVGGGGESQVFQKMFGSGLFHSSLGHQLCGKRSLKGEVDCCEGIISMEL